ncbi:DUF1508 domain-containing protein, partial [Paracidovorax avenae]|uniref:DUF1508 domain-containing protein n=1 Tax=Paracidovorax avenae TaxID=80867 RepID=UPI001CEF7EFA
AQEVFRPRWLARAVILAGLAIEVVCNREADGRFYFKLVAADGRLLLQSTGFTAPRDAGQAIARLQKEPGALAALAAHLAPVEGVEAGDVEAALQALLQASEA